MRSMGVSSLSCSSLVIVNASMKMWLLEHYQSYIYQGIWYMKRLINLSYKPHAIGFIHRENIAASAAVPFV